jgi:hypothetical protein
MKRHLFYTILLAFIATTAITLLGITEVIRIKDGYLTPLMGAFLIELGATIFAIAKREDLLSEPPSSTNLESHPRAIEPIAVIAADYTVDHMKQDVTAAVRGCIHDGVLNVVSDTVALNAKDMKYGFKKMLRIHCRLLGKDRVFFVPEGERLILP